MIVSLVVKGLFSARHFYINCNKNRISANEEICVLYFQHLLASIIDFTFTCDTDICDLSNLL